MWTIQCTSSCVSSVNFGISDRRRPGALNGPISLSFNSYNILGPRPKVRAASGQSSSTFRTCRNCKQPFDPESNHPRACRFHTAHFGGETKRKFESVYTGGTMDTIGGGEIVEYWHCCGSPDQFDPGCEAAPHASYDD